MLSESDIFFLQTVYIGAQNPLMYLAAAFVGATR